MRISSTAVLILVSSATALLGLVAGYKIAEKRLGDEFDKQLAVEVEKVKGFYKIPGQPFASPEEAVEKLIVPTQDQVEEIEKTVVRERVAYEKIVPAMLSDEPVIKNVFRQGPPDNCDDELPIRVVTREEFEECEWDTTTLTWYQRDDVLCGADEEPIKDVEGHLGKVFREKFGMDSNDPHTICVINEVLETGFEVVMHLSSFQEEVLGETFVPEQPLTSGRER